MKERFLQRQAETFLEGRHGKNGCGLQPVKGVFITESARQEDAAFEMIAHDTVLNHLQFMRDTCASDQLEPPLRITWSDAREGFDQDRLGFPTADRADTENYRLSIGKIGRRGIGGE